MTTLAGRVALVTGAGRGTGRAIAEALAAEGAHVAVNYRASAESAEELTTAINDAGGTASAYQADVSSYDEAAALLAKVAETLGKPQIVVNNAGIS